MPDDTRRGHDPDTGGGGKRVFWGFLLIAGFFLVAEHRAHVVQYLPFLLLLACPLMHLFHGHGGHGKHEHHDRDKDEEDGRGGKP